ncbi:hypothetical protein [Claveliimonas bilis]|uniref:hypothetical protein n=1 Tax=Claveliimonas bilis TaxID=3028070 RepID=UPI00292DDF34|nr:hypothetical protein [Claveliimonas bilis]BDZ81377.1 hypothetical protein Lac3_25860 [Claveliimonas bilis]
MWTVIFIITTVICAIGWMIKHISCMAIIYYMETNGYRLPNDREIEECTREAAKHLFK